MNQYDLNGRFIKQWKFIIDVERELGIKSQNISQCCTGKFKTAGGYMWRHSDNCEDIEPVKYKENPKHRGGGKKVGQPRISKRGRRKLRRTMYESARALMTWNPVFQDVFLYYRNRKKNPLGGMQAKIAVACKAIRVFYVVLQTGCDFDEEKFRKDIIRLEAA